MLNVSGKARVARGPVVRKTTLAGCFLIISDLPEVDTPEPLG
ncbi:hypothetical protein [Sulfitobacter sp. SK012]|nr:hypothetical protein [Sulfitobacter sp. SK012]